MEYDRSWVWIVRADQGATDGRVVDACDRDRLQSFVSPVYIVAEPVYRDALAIVDAWND